MECPRCRTANPEVARFCQRCGQNLLSGDMKRRQNYAAAPNEPVASFSIVSTIMPHGSGVRPQTYRTALLVALAFPVVAAALGLLSFAIVTAAFAIPVVYIVYIYDVNLWEDEPVNVTVMAFAFTAVLSLGFTLLWARGPLKGLEKRLGDQLAGSPRISTLLILCLLVPVVAEILKEVGPLFLASRPAFDDLMDGLTFGVISGVAYAAFETLILYGSNIVNAPMRPDNTNAALWVSIVITSGLIKPIVYGTATGIACAEYSGLGEGYDGFRPRYFRGFLEAVVANIIFQLGVYLCSFLSGTGGALLGMVWGLVVAAALVLRVRTVLHTGLMEAALEAAARDSGAKHQVRDVGFCPQCEMPLIDGASFCVNCGTSIRAVSKDARRSITSQTEAATAGPEPPPPPPPGGSVAVDEKEEGQ